MINAEQLPSEIRATDRALLWNREQRNGKPTKVPYSPHRPLEHAAVDNPATWGSFDAALAAVEDGKADGVGYVLGDGVVGIDLDKCRDPQSGLIDDAALAIIHALDSYTEVSPSGTGVHILVRGELPPGGRRKGRIEMYADGRYFTLTGHRVSGTPNTICERTGPLAQWHAKIFGITPPQPVTPRRIVQEPTDFDDRALIEKARAASNGSKFCALWEGDTSGYASASEADQALCNLLCFWTDADAGRMDALFRQSGLFRDKWDERRGHETYGNITISTAIAGGRDTYGSARRPSVTVVAGAEESDACADEFAQDCELAEPPPFTVSTPAESFISRYLAYAQQRTDAPVIAHELMAVGILSALAGPIPRLPIATKPNGWSLCLWCTYIVNSTEGRKTSVIESATDIVEAILGRDAMIPWEGSPQGLIQRLQTRDGRAAVFCRDEYSGLLRQINRGGHLAGLEQTFIRAYDGGRIENIRTRKRGQDDTDVVENPYLVKLTGTAWDSFTLAATIDNVLDGFLARFIFVTGTATPKAMRRSNDSLEAARLELIDHARRFNIRAGRTPRILVSDDVLEAAFALEQDWRRLALKAARQDAAGPALKRLSDAVLKVAALLALDDESHYPAEVTCDHLAIATRMAARWRDSTLHVIDALGRSEFGRQCEAILMTIRLHLGGIPVSRLYRKHRNMRKRDLDEVLTALEMQERIQRFQQQTGGRAAVILKALEGKKG